jgi:hypothetical protein
MLRKLIRQNGSLQNKEPATLPRGLNKPHTALSPPDHHSQPPNPSMQVTVPQLAVPTPPRREDICGSRGANVPPKLGPVGGLAQVMR